MLTPNDDIGTDAFALPRRNIFAAPAASPTRRAGHTHGVFDAAAACPSDGLTDASTDDGRVDAPASNGARSRGRFVTPTRLVAVAGVAIVVVALLTVRGHDDVVRPTPAPRPVRTQPTPASVARPAVRPSPKPRTARARHTPSEATRRPSTPPRSRLRRAAPGSPAAAPQPAPVPLPRRPAPALPAKPARVPTGSPPEFM